MNRIFPRPFFFGIGISILASFISSCTSTNPSPRYTRSIPTVSDTLPHNDLPDHWSTIQEVPIDPSILTHIVNSDSTAIMILKEIHMDSSAAGLLPPDDICLAGQLSMRLKIEQHPTEYRITIVPQRFGTDSNSCSYVYMERELLRRVIVFRKSGFWYELELKQEASMKDFEQLSAEQWKYVTMIVNR